MTVEDLNLLLICCMFILTSRYWAYFSPQSVATEYLQLTEDNNSSRKDYHRDPHDLDPTVTVTRADVYDR